MQKRIVELGRPAAGWQICLLGGLGVLAACSSSSRQVLPEAAEIVVGALNEAHNGNLGGILDADEMCASQAALGERREEFRAFLSNSRFDLKDLVSAASASTVPLVNTKGEQLYANWNDIFNNGRWASGPRIYTFDGKAVTASADVTPAFYGAQAWHGSDTAGVEAGERTCHDWTSDLASDRGASSDLDGRRVLQSSSQTCNRTLAVLCVGAASLPSYGTCAAAGLPCKGDDPCAVDPVCGDDLQCRPRSLLTCADGLTCTKDSCDGLGGCAQETLPGWCAIDGECYEDGQADETGCQACDSQANPTGWTARAAACAIGGKCYQPGDPEPGGCGVCDPSKNASSWTPRTGDLCKIAGQCYNDGDKHPEGCAICDVSTSAAAWTAIGDACLIGGACYAAGTKDSTGCSSCQPNLSRTSWSPFPTEVCKIGGKCYEPGEKHPEFCATCDPSNTAIGWTVSGNDCLIGNKCYGPGTRDPSGCNECAPTTSKTAWTPITGQHCQIGGQCYAPAALHPQGCAECDPSSSVSEWTAKGNDCLINNTCYAAGATNGCGTCNPSVSRTDWTPIAGCFEIIIAALDQAYTGSIGGIANADALCASQAAGAGLTGTFKAFLSSSTRNVKDLVTGTNATRPVVNKLGQQLFSSWSAIFNTSGTTVTWSTAYMYSFAGVRVTSTALPSPDWNDGAGWTGSTPAGVVSAGKTCQDWTSNVSTDRGGSAELDLRQLLRVEDRACNLYHAVLCARISL